MLPSVEGLPDVVCPLQCVAGSLLSIILCILAAEAPGCRRGLPERLGLERAGVLHIPSGPERVIWIHAVSLGEVVAVVPLARELRLRYPIPG